MNQTIHGSERHRRVLEDFAPFAEGLVCRYENGSPFVASANEFEQHGRFGLIFRDVDQIV